MLNVGAIFATTTILEFTVDSSSCLPTTTHDLASHTSSSYGTWTLRRIGSTTIPELGLTDEA